MAGQSLGLIGVGAFGAFFAPHLAPHFDVCLYDPVVDTATLARRYDMQACDLATAAACDIVVLAVPVQRMEDALKSVAPHVRPGALVMDVASVKVKPLAWMQKILPAHADIVGTHPLFGPQSGRNGITGLNIAVCDVRGNRGRDMANFFADKLKLKVFEATPEDHDRELAFVHGLTHMIGKVIVSLDLPKFRLTTKTYDLMDQAIEFIRYDSDELFKAIERENPYAAEAKEAFFTAARRLEEKLSRE